MRKLLLALAVIATVLTVDAAELLRVKLKNANPVEFLLSAQPEIGFAGDKLTVKVPDADGLSFELDNVESIEISDVSSVADPAASGVTVSADAYGITFAGIGVDAAVLVCDIAGRVVVDTRASDTYTIVRSDFPGGLYIVKINTFTAKIRL